jgi:glycosyltransferase involved in cell wall biosynthesis
VSAAPGASIVVPAHNESALIADLLGPLSREQDLEIVVVCNGCTDDTAQRAREAAPHATVLEIDEASKRAALDAGDEVAQAFPRLYVDADVQIDPMSVRSLVAALAEPGVHAVAPRRRLDRSGSSRLVRAYLDVWETLPAVRSGLYGRGVIGVDEEGVGRLHPRPRVMGDDLFVHHSFSDSERRIVDRAESLVLAPRTLTALRDRRVRAALGNSELVARGTGRSTPVTGTGTSSGTALVRFALQHPMESWKAVVFAWVTVAARQRARRMRRAGSTEWLRDETSRAGPAS